MFDAQGRVTVANRQYRDMYRLSADVVKPGCTLDAAASPQGGFSGDPGTAAASWRRSERDAEWRIEQADGRVVSVLDRPIPQGGWITIHRDVTAEVKAETELAETQSFLKTIIEHVPSAIIVKTAQDFRYVLVNKAGEAFIGKPAEAVIGKTVHEIYAPAEADQLHALIASCSRPAASGWTTSSRSTTPAMASPMWRSTVTVHGARIPRTPGNATRRRSIIWRITMR
jgi:PAS domain-containing protein